ncbi:hypothetical protein Goklo_002080 [Gossypium klotzschianum]|uniref:DUF4283 domain-containing protein n=1 Tax=Gossypium klotzschianum TaxID=34286 RepID=A0A7J8VS39_9ROSI|nr:hypothetical protein [Gossypium klotzschianum]
MLWSKQEAVEVKMVGENLFIFQFSSSIARDWVLDHSSWHIQNKLMLSRVPLELFTQKGLSYITSALGALLYMNNIITFQQRLTYTQCRSFSHSGKHYSKKNEVKVWRVNAPDCGATLISTFEVSSKGKPMVLDISLTLKPNHVFLGDLKPKLALLAVSPLVRSLMATKQENLGKGKKKMNNSLAKGR